MSENAKKFKQIALQAEPIRLYGRNLMVRDLFRVFSKQNAQKIPLLVLSTTEGRILSFLQDDVEDEELEGRQVSVKERRDLCPEWTEFKCNEEFLLLLQILRKLQGYRRCCPGYWKALTQTNSGTRIF